MTKEEYEQLCKKVTEYQVLDNKIDILKFFDNKHLIDSRLVYCLDDDLQEKIYSLVKNVINEQTSRLEKKLEEL